MVKLKSNIPADVNPTDVVGCRAYLLDAIGSIPLGTECTIKTINQQGKVARVSLDGGLEKDISLECLRLCPTTMKELEEEKAIFDEYTTFLQERMDYMVANNKEQFNEVEYKIEKIAAEISISDPEQVKKIVEKLVIHQ